MSRGLSGRGIGLGLLGAALVGSASAELLGGCGTSSAPSPFGPDAGSQVGGSGGGVTFDGGPDADPTLGGPCTVDEQCDDGVSCTFDRCDMTVDRCRFTPDDSQCLNDLYCDGLEKCNLGLGCGLGEPVTCTDGNPCTIDTCKEDTDTCEQVPRDADGDGDPDIHCDGGDCDDLNPMVSSNQPEVCGNGLDDDCDNDIDEPACFLPANDKCFNPLDLTSPGTYATSTAAAGLDYSASCTVQNPQVARDIVAALLLAAGPLRDVQLTARTTTEDVALALLAQCGQASSEIACSPGYEHPTDGRVAKLRGRGVGDTMMASALALYVTTTNGSPVTLRYEVLPASSKPTNETCGTALPLTQSVPTLASTVDAAIDLGSACPAQTGELVYSFTLAAPQDVDVYATSIDGDGLPVISLRDAACATPADEIACTAAAIAHVFRHSLLAGTYYVAVSATAPTESIVTLELSAPTPPPADESCNGAPAIVPNQTINVPLSSHQDDHNTGCLAGAVDAAYALDLTQPSDVLLLGRYSSGDSAAVVLSQPACALPSDQIACGMATLSPARARKRNLAAGSYRVLAESGFGQPMQLTALARPAVPPTVVAFANKCSDALVIPASGGFFQGNTANAQPDFDAGCDLGGQPPGGAPDQILKLTLSQTKRVVLDMLGSGYSTMLSVREGPTCPGSEVPLACAAGYYPERSFLDLTLAPATYFIIVDGYAGDDGPWFLDVHVVDP